eukprot:5151414-Prymnesium_polylepis.2
MTPTCARLVPAVRAGGQRACPQGQAHAAAHGLRLRRVQIGGRRAVRDQGALLAIAAWPPHRPPHTRPPHAGASLAAPCSHA